MVVYQQGDVVLIKLSTSVPSGTDKKKTNVIQEGEHTGHAHRITQGDADICVSEGNMFVRARSASTITHEEHLPVTIEQGDYEVRIVRQKDPFTKLVSKVVD
jgi:glutamine cyclotransferase